MADVELVIKIPEETYNFLKGGSFIVSGERNGKTILQQFCRAIYNGTPLPENHGKIVDIDKLLEEMRATRTYDISFALERVKPIIEADKGRK